MEWTESAERNLDEIMVGVREHALQVGANPVEVSADVEARLREIIAERQLDIVTAQDLDMAAASLGLYTKSDAKRDAKFRDKGGRGKRSYFWFFIFGVIIPLAAWLTELGTGFSADSFVNPFPSFLGVLLVAAVPVVNFFVWRGLRRGEFGRPRLLLFLLGMTCCICLCYTVMFSFVFPVAVMGLAAIIVGIGLLALLPLSPLFALFVCSSAARRVGRLVHKGSAGVFLGGFGLGALLCAIMLFPLVITYTALNMTTSSDEGRSERGIMLLRHFGDTDVLHSQCFWRSRDMDTIQILCGKQPSRSDIQTVYYRMTGESYLSKTAPRMGLRGGRRATDEFVRDPGRGGDAVTGILKGLDLVDSRMDGSVYLDGFSAYTEWTFVFQNNFTRQREARFQMNLPEGAVVSRLTLWIEGEPCEAAFGGRKQTKTAYKKVVRRRRDPVLVTTMGPDSVLVQCFPVPPNGGQMKIRVGVTMPLINLTGATGMLRLPWIADRNFSIDSGVKHAVWLHGASVMPEGTVEWVNNAGDALPEIFGELTDTQLSSPSSALVFNGLDFSKMGRELDFTDAQFAVEQRCEPVPALNPSCVNVVLDGSKRMKPYAQELIPVLKGLSKRIPVRLFIASDVLADAGYEVSLDDEDAVRCFVGGQDSVPALRKALNRCLASDDEVVLWLSGRQEYLLKGGERLRQLLSRKSVSTRFFVLPVESGPNQLLEKLGDVVPPVQQVTRTADLELELDGLFDWWLGEEEYFRQVRERQKASGTEDDFGGSVVRLWADEQVDNSLKPGEEDKGAAIDLATLYRLVTPVSGAVVLETAQQYKDADLEPGKHPTSHIVPEPGTMVMFVIAAAILGVLRWYRVRFRRRLQVGTAF